MIKWYVIVEIVKRNFLNMKGDRSLEEKKQRCIRKMLRRSQAELRLCKHGTMLAVYHRMCRAEDGISGYGQELDLANNDIEYCQRPSDTSTKGNESFLS